MGALVSELSSA